MAFRGDVAERPSLTVRLGALVRRSELDRSLAAGRRPVDARTSWRARQLTGRRSRQKLAERLVHLLERANQPSNRRGAAVPFNRSEILRCRELVRKLAAELVADDTVGPRGVLKLWDLLRDGGSVVYAPAPEGALELELRHARTMLFLA